MKKNEIKVAKTARYYTLNENRNIDTILYVLHGYAQLASKFIEEFDYLKNTNVLVVAPEGLSLFYGKERTPVSSWMTSYDRENEINDYINYLNSLDERIKQKYPNSKIIKLGFSQGVSTLMRWVISCKNKQLELHLCCGSIPPEIAKNDRFINKVKTLYYYYGKNDRLMKEDQFKLAIKKLNQLELNPSITRFDGIHEIPAICHGNIKTYLK